MGGCKFRQFLNRHTVFRSLTCFGFLAICFGFLSSLPASTALIFDQGSCAKPVVPDITFGPLDPNDPTPPSYSFTNVARYGEILVSSGSHFEGQMLGETNNSLSDTTPVSPLRIASTSAGVSTVFDTAFLDFVLGGNDGVTFLKTPLAIHISHPASCVSFDSGHFDAAGTTIIEANDAAGNSLGFSLNSVAGREAIRISNMQGGPIISGISLYTSNPMMDWEGFGIDNFRFRIAPEPDALICTIWVVLAAFTGRRVWLGQS